MRTAHDSFIEARRHPLAANAAAERRAGRDLQARQGFLQRQTRAIVIDVFGHFEALFGAALRFFGARDVRSPRRARPTAPGP